MQVWRTPPSLLDRHRIGARLDREEGVAPLLIRPDPPIADEVRVERSIALVNRMEIAPRRVRLPEFDDGAAHGPAILIEDAASQVHQLTDREAARSRLSEVDIAARELALEFERTGRLGPAHRPPVQGLRGGVRPGIGVAGDRYCGLDARRPRVVAVWQIVGAHGGSSSNVYGFRVRPARGPPSGYSSK